MHILSRFALMITLLLPLFGCATLQATSTASQLAQAKRYFEAGFYKRARYDLLPLACDGNAQAQYAVGYMYYNGYGVAEDKETGLFWIKRGAKGGYQPAILAMQQLNKKQGNIASQKKLS